MSVHYITSSNVMQEIHFIRENACTCYNTLFSLGKSTFINCIRGLLDIPNTVSVAYSETGPAPVGIVETVAELRRYRWPEKYLSHLALWDVPASDKFVISTKTYFHDLKLHMFDCLLLLTSGRITQFDVDICKQAFMTHVPIMIVLTKADISVATEKGFERTTFKRKLTAEEEKQIIQRTIETLKNEASKELSRNGIPVAKLLSFVIAPVSFRDMLLDQLDEEAGQCPPLETYELLDQCIQIAVKNRDTTETSSENRDGHQCASNTV